MIKTMDIRKLLPCAAMYALGLLYPYTRQE